MHNQLSRVTLKPLSRKRWTDKKTTHLVKKATNKPALTTCNPLNDWVDEVLARHQLFRQTGQERILEGTSLRIGESIQKKYLEMRRAPIEMFFWMIGKPSPYKEPELKPDPQQHQEFFLEPDPTHRKVDKDWIMTNMFPNPSTQLKKP